jgi:tRNA(Ile)-lysidine synthase
MADVRRAVRSSWDKYDVKEGQVISVACSGGADSLALASACIFEGKRAGIRVIAVIVNHNLQEGSDLVALKAKEQLIGLGYELVEVLSVRVEKSSLGLEADARNARYEALEEFALKHNVRYTMLGHTLDDQAETVLLGLARGSGPKALSGMPLLSTDGKYLRPLLQIRRAETVSYCKDTALEFWSDPQNLDTKFSRVRARLNVLPLMEKELGPGISEALARTAEIIQEDLAYLDSQAAKQFVLVSRTSADSIVLDVALLAELPKALSNRVIHKALAFAGAEPTKAQIDSVWDLTINWHGQKPLNLPSVRVERKGKEIILFSTNPMKPGAS